MKVARYYLNLVWQVRMLAVEGKKNAVRKEHETWGAPRGGKKEVGPGAGI